MLVVDEIIGLIPPVILWFFAVKRTSKLDKVLKISVISFMMGSLLPAIYDALSATQSGPLSLHFEEISSVLVPVVLRECQLVYVGRSRYSPYTLLYPFDLVAVFVRRITM